MTAEENLIRELTESIEDVHRLMQMIEKSHHWYGQEYHRSLGLIDSRYTTRKKHLLNWYQTHCPDHLRQVRHHVQHIKAIKNIIRRTSHPLELRGLTWGNPLVDTRAVWSATPDQTPDDQWDTKTPRVVTSDYTKMSQRSQRLAIHDQIPEGFPVVVDRQKTTNWLSEIEQRWAHFKEHWRVHKDLAPPTPGKEWQKILDLCEIDYPRWSWGWPYVYYLGRIPFLGDAFKNHPDLRRDPSPIFKILSYLSPEVPYPPSGYARMYDRDKTMGHDLIVLSSIIDDPVWRQLCPPNPRRARAIYVMMRHVQTLWKMRLSMRQMELKYGGQTAHQPDQDGGRAHTDFRTNHHILDHYEHHRLFREPLPDSEFKWSQDLFFYLKEFFSDEIRHNNQQELVESRRKLKLHNAHLTLLVGILANMMAIKDRLEKRQICQSDVVWQDIIPERHRENILARRPEFRDTPWWTSCTSDEVNLRRQFLARIYRCPVTRDRADKPVQVKILIQTPDHQYFTPANLNADALWLALQTGSVVRAEDNSWRPTQDDIERQQRPADWTVNPTPWIIPDYLCDAFPLYPVDVDVPLYLRRRKVTENERRYLISMRHGLTPELKLSTEGIQSRIDAAKEIERYVFGQDLPSTPVQGNWKQGIPPHLWRGDWTNDLWRRPQPSSFAGLVIMVLLGICGGAVWSLEDVDQFVDDDQWDDVDYLQ